MGFDATGPMQQVIQDVRGRKGDATATCAAWPSDPLPAIAKAWAMIRRICFVARHAQIDLRMQMYVDTIDIALLDGQRPQNCPTYYCYQHQKKICSTTTLSHARGAPIN
jgi:hypothetical protein